MLRALKYRNYRLFFAGQGISLIGTWMQMAAIGWLVYRLTGSSFYLGLVAFCTHIPVLLGSLVGGIFADRWPKRRIIIITQTLAMIQAFLLAAMIASGNITMMRIILLSIFLGIIMAFDMPTRQAFVPEMVDDENDLPNAIALNSMIFNIARQIGPVVAGFLIAMAGEAVCFFLNAVSFLAVIYSLAAMRNARSRAAKHNGTMLAGIKDGLSYSFSFMPIRSILLYTAAMSLVAMPYSVLMPVFAKTILHGGPQTYGALMWSIGIGAFLGAAFLARRKTVEGLDMVVLFAAGVFAAGVIGFSFSKNFWLSFVLIALPGFGIMVQMASINTILQTIVDDHMRGRVLSLHVMAFIGIMPLGHLLAGISAQHFGAPNTLLFSGLLSVVVMILFARKLPSIRRLIHPIYVKKGIIPEVAAGLDTAARFSAQAND
ncbi:MAG: MFS transporter [Planctomycetes bacterium]|nr:MFS transporter [Planctomycetota bacterium]MBU1518296.1 MFS transporter [Planctomycetota bacterium]MBU2457877.1 MFS transporter [Planctomycetota bacterium]MBU2596825.1 MFS transporter [Planctomycetota bacterium]